jgi:hypothetical protein
MALMWSMPCCRPQPQPLKAPSQATTHRPVLGQQPAWHIKIHVLSWGTASTSHTPASACMHGGTKRTQHPARQPGKNPTTTQRQSSESGVETIKCQAMNHAAEHTMNITTREVIPPEFCPPAPVRAVSHMTPTLTA